jgi:TolB-like protein/DNA-binding winged helix-turn-helix (wHTH) protein/Tfp pilus assembly protein PilF
MDPTPIGAYRFGVFELDVREGELRKQGRLIRLRGQPLQILLALIERPGVVVTREELQQRLWPDDTFVEFDHSLNTAIKRLRETLGDTASTPRFVETIPRRGYRFVAAIEPIVTEPAPVAVAPSITSDSPTPPADGLEPPTTRRDGVTGATPAAAAPFIASDSHTLPSDALEPPPTRRDGVTGATPAVAAPFIASSSLTRPSDALEPPPTRRDGVTGATPAAAAPFIASEGPTLPSEALEPPTTRRGGATIAAAAAAALVIVVAAALIMMWRDSRAATTTTAAAAISADAVGPGADAERGIAGTGADAAEARAPRVAVLPFQNLSGDEERAYVAAGFTEELISQLGRLAPGRLGVIARSSSATFASSSSRPSSPVTTDRPTPSPSPAPSPSTTPSSAPSIEEIARALDADYIIEGSVRAQGERYRVAVRLVRSRDVMTIWSDLHEGALLDLMTLQRDVGEQVARHLAIAVLPSDRAALARATTADSRAYEDYLRGVSELARGPVDGFAGAQAAFERAIARDSKYALAYAGLAETHIRQQDYYIISPARAQQSARPAAEKALALDDSLAEAHCALADVFSRGEGQTAEAERAFARALALNPSRAETHLRYSSHLERVGRARDARARLALARGLAPRSADVITETAWMDMEDGRLDAAAALASEALRYQPDFPFARYVLGQIALRRSAAKEAVTQFEQARVTSGQAPKYLAALATAYLADGRRDEAARLLETLIEQSRDRYVPPGVIDTLGASLRASAGQLASGVSRPSASR